MVIAPNGTYVGEPGYARGNYMRSTPGFGDPTMVNLIPPDGRTINQILPSDLMCKSTQTSQTQSNGSPRLQAAAGDAVALRFQENGHVTLPDNQPGKPSNRGTVYVYGTNKASPDDSFLAIHRVWNADGTGGDGRGRLLSTQNFDDGQCYQVNGGAISQQRQQQYSHPADTLMGADLWCQQNIQLPSDVQSGEAYTLYWVWDWPTMPGTFGFPNGKQEIYTTCMDIDIVDNSGTDAVSNAQVNYAQGQPLNHAGVSAQLADIANPTAVTGKTIPFNNVASTSSAKNNLSKTTFMTLTSSVSTGSTIGFSASATGPVSGGASEASASAATATETGVPAFLSVHTGSTAGPGIETQTFTVLPISVTTTDTITGTTPDPSLVSMLVASLEKLATNPHSTGPQITGGANAVGNAQVETYTEYESTTQTVLQTVYLTMYTKRDAGESSSFAPTTPPYPTPFPSQGFGRPHGFPHHNFTRPNGFTHPNFTHPNFTHTYGSAPWMSGSGASGSGRPHHPLGGFNHNGSRTDDLTTLTVQSVVSVTTYVPPSASATSDSDSQLPSSAAPAAVSTVTVTGTVFMTTSLPSALSPTAAATPEVVPVLPASPSSSLSDQATATTTSEIPALTVVPIPDPAPSPTTSTDHAAFRLKARNPFVMLGWMTESKSAEPTP